MEETQLPGQPEKSGCANCGSEHIVEGYPTALCAGCRELFIKYPVPLSIKIFAGAILILLLSSMFSFPKHLTLGLHLEKGKQYEKNHEYKAAQREFELVAQQLPRNVEANGYLLIAAFYNQDFQTCYKASERLDNINIEDNELYQKMSAVTARAGDYYADDSLAVFLQTMGDSSGHIPDTAFRTWLTSHPHNVYAMLSYASNLYDEANYTVCDSVLKDILKFDAEYTPALRLLASSQREQQLYDEAILTSNKILIINKDAGYAYAIKARIYLKQQKDALALEQALKAVEKDKSDPYNSATLALAYHFNNQPGKRDAVIKEAQALNDSSATRHIQYALDVINKKENFRN